MCQQVLMVEVACSLLVVLSIGYSSVLLSTSCSSIAMAAWRRPYSIAAYGCSPIACSGAYSGGPIAWQHICSIDIAVHMDRYSSVL